MEALLVCPACQGDVAPSADFYRCATCGTAYPIRHGIPDFRLWPDEYVSIGDELAKNNKLFAPPAATFRQLLTRYYDLSPDSPRKLTARHVAPIVTSATRDAALLRNDRDARPHLACVRRLD